MLETIWFILWGVLWAVYFVLDGFDLGLGTLHPFLAKNEEEKHMVHAAMGPYWDGNEVWLITAGGVTFAAFPTAYAVMFSSLYSPLMLILFSLIFRGVALEYRHHAESAAAKKAWDWALFLGSALPALLFGVAFANIFAGIPFDSQGIWRGSLLGLLNVYGILGGLLFLAMFTTHGAIWLSLKTEGEIAKRAQKAASGLWVAWLVMAVIFLVATADFTNLWANYLKTPILWLIPLAAVAALLACRWFLAQGKLWMAWAASGLAIASCTWFGVAGLFPNLLPSSFDPAASLTAFNASSSQLTLTIMLVVAGIMVPLVILYQAWAYVLFKGKYDAGEGY